MERWVRSSAACVYQVCYLTTVTDYVCSTHTASVPRTSAQTYRIYVLGRLVGSKRKVKDRVKRYGAAAVRAADTLPGPQLWQSLELVEPGLVIWRVVRGESESAGEERERPLLQCVSYKSCYLAIAGQSGECPALWWRHSAMAVQRYNIANSLPITIYHKPKSTHKIKNNIVWS